MAITDTRLDEIAAWCEFTEDLSEERRHAQRRFFDEDDPRPVRYWPGAGDDRSRQRRFLGWFMFDHQLPGGERAATRAARALYQGTAQEQALRAISGTRFVLAIVASVLPGRSVLLELEDDRFEIRNRIWSRSFTPLTAVVAHLVPTGRPGEWLAGPGWGEWPLRFGSHMRQSLRSFQPDPLEVERLLQSREPAEDEGRPASPQDTSFAEAVARMTAAARAAELTGLVISASKWEALVVKYMKGPDLTSFSEEIVRRVGDADSVEDIDRWLQLAMNIWNNTSQPDRGGKSPNELLRQPRSEG